MPVMRSGVCWLANMNDNYKRSMSCFQRDMAQQGNGKIIVRINTSPFSAGAHMTYMQGKTYATCHAIQTKIEKNTNVISPLSRPYNYLCGRWMNAQGAQLTNTLQSFFPFDLYSAVLHPPTVYTTANHTTRKLF